MTISVAEWFTALVDSKCLTDYVVEHCSVDQVPVHLDLCCLRPSEKPAKSSRKGPSLRPRPPPCRGLDEGLSQAAYNDKLDRFCIPSSLSSLWPAPWPEQAAVQR